jgi:SAM-dependent methyltransferase
MSNRWQSADVPRGDSYDERFDALAAAGQDVHGEATLVASYGPRAVLDAGCGTGRVAVELDRRGFAVMGADIDPAMLDVARRKAPHLTWLEADLAEPLPTERAFDVVVLAGNVLIFVEPGTEAAVIAGLAERLEPGGRLIAGYTLVPGGFAVAAHDAAASAAGLELEDRWSTWDRESFSSVSTYAVSVHRRPL